MTNPKKSKPGEYEILAGHEKIGSKFTRFPNMLQETSYVENTLPELLWIALLSDALGQARAARIITAISQSIANSVDDDDRESSWFVFTSRLANLSTEAIKAVLARLKEEELLSKLQYALSPFVHFYPMFPVHWLEIQPTIEQGYLQRFKTLLGSLLDKTSRPSTIMLTTSVYGLAVTGKLLLPEGSLAADFNAVMDYPDTGHSQMVASSVRAIMLTLIRFAIPETGGFDWAQNFWQRGLELEPVDYPNLLRGEIT